ncbi:MAG TPA: DUF2946 family protein [Azospirillum sp.]|nr:DUF2946 family protein [Azospirillum sp.]
MRTAVHRTRPHDDAPIGAWRRLAACVAVFALLALSAHAFLAPAGFDSAGEICSVAGAAPASDDFGNAEGQPAAKPVHCPECTAAPGSFAAPPPAVALVPPASPPALAVPPAAAFHLVPPPYLDGPPSRAPPALV